MTYAANAKSGDSHFINQIKSGKFAGEVHSVFDRVINIQIVDQCELFTVANNTMDNGPNTMVTDIVSFSEMTIAVHDRVYAKHNRLCIMNKIEIMIDQVNHWNSILPAYPANKQQLRNNVSAARAFIEQYGKGGGMKSSFKSQSRFDEELSKLLADGSQFLLNALSEGSIEEAVQAAARITGLGHGLTPSGDDFLVGLFAVINMPECPLNEFTLFCSEVVRKSAGRTNDISYMALKKASTGQIRESLIRLLQDLTDGSEDSFIASLERVLQIGSLSGTDIATGIVSGLELSTNKSWR